MAYADKDFTPRTGSMMLSHTETMLKRVIHFILGESLVQELNVTTVGIFGFPFSKNLEQLEPTKHGSCACLVNYPSSTLKQNTISQWLSNTIKSDTSFHLFCALANEKPAHIFYTTTSQNSVKVNMTSGVFLTLRHSLLNTYFFLLNSPKSSHIKELQLNPKIVNCL